MFPTPLLLLSLAPIITTDGFMQPIAPLARHQRFHVTSPPLNGRRDDDEFDFGDDDGVYASRTKKGRSNRYDDDVEFFDLDDDDDYEDDFDNDEETFASYNGIIPNPLLDAMDPDGVYERLGPELFSDWTFWRDMILFVAFLALFTRDTHHYGTFDSVIEGLERLPPNFIPI